MPTLNPSKTPTPSGPTPTPADAMGVPVTDLQGLVINFWHPWQGDLADRVNEAADTFNRTNEWGLTVHVTPWYSAGALREALETSQKGGGQAVHPPDVVAAVSEQLAAWALANNPLLVDLTPYVNNPRVGLSKAEAEEYEQVFWEQDRAGNLRFGLPALRNARVLFYNATWAKELGFNTSPRTPADFETQACAAAVKNNTAGKLELYGTGGWLVDSDPLTTLSWLGAFGAAPIPKVEGQAYNFESQQGEEALAFLQELMEKGCAWIGNPALEPHESFARRKALFYAGGLQDIYDQEHWQQQLNSKDEWQVLPFPNKEGQPFVYSKGYSYGVLRSDARSQLGGWLFVHWLTTPSVAAKLGETLPSFPVSSAVAAQYNDYRENFPWSQVLPLHSMLRPVPALSTWLAVRRPLEDAAWSVYHLPAENLPQVLPQLDEMAAEMLKEVR